jgi:peptide/nickel transport system permease protein
MTPRRLLGPLGTLVLAALAAFVIVRAMPGDVAELVLFAQGVVPTQELAAGVRASHGLDAPAWRQFVAWGARAMTGDLGVSYRNGEPVLAGLLARLPTSLAIGCGGLALGAALGVALGIASAGMSRAADRIGRGLALLAQAVPAFCLAIVVIWIFGVELRWIRPFTGGPLERVLLPTLLVALYAAGRLSRIVRKEVLAATQAPWFRAARAKGATRARALVVHAGPFALLAALAVLRVESAWVIGGTAVLEVVFGSPGISAWVVESISGRDYAVLQGYILAVVAWMLLVRAVIAALVARLDPRRSAA